MPPTLSTPSTARRLGAAHLDTPVRALMTPGVVTLVEDASVRQAFAALVAHHVHAVLVVGHQRGMPLGWVTARGLLPYLDSDDDLLCVRDAISEEPRTIDPAATAREAIVALSSPETSHLLVTPRQSLVPEGVISDLDVAGVAVR
jgi:CBS domain-containing protein